MNSSLTVLLVIFAFFVQLSQEGVIKVSHKKPIKIKIQAKPSLLIKKPLPLMLLKKPLPLLLLKRHHGKYRRSWPLSALFTFKAVKYAKLAFLTSLAKKRRRRSADMPKTIFSAPTTRVWLDEQRMAANSAKSAENPRSNVVFRLDLPSKTNGIVSKKFPLGAKQYNPLSTDSATASSIFIDMTSKEVYLNPIIGGLAEAAEKEDSLTTTSPLLQDPIDDTALHGNGSEHNNPVHSRTRTLIFFNSRSDDEENFLRNILGRFTNPIMTSNITNCSTSVSVPEIDEHSKTSTAAAETYKLHKMEVTANPITSHIEEVTTESSVTERTEPTFSTDSSTPLDLWTITEYVSTEKPITLTEVTDEDILKSSTESTESFTEPDQYEEVYTFSNESVPSTAYEEVDNKTDLPVTSIVTSVVELTTTRESQSIAFVNWNNITTAMESVTTEQSIITTDAVAVISVKSVPRNIAKLATTGANHRRGTVSDTSSMKVPLGYGLEKNNSSTWHPERPGVAFGFEFFTDSNADLETTSPKQSSEESADFTSEPRLVRVKEVKPGWTSILIANTSDVGRNYTKKMTQIVRTTTQLPPKTTSTSNPQETLSTEPAVATTPAERLKPSLLEADVTKILDEVHSFDADQLSKSMHHPSFKHMYDKNNKVTSNSDDLSRTTTTIPLRELDEPSSTPDTRVIYDGQMKPKVEEVKTVKRKPTNSVRDQVLTIVGKKSKQIKPKPSTTATHRPVRKTMNKTPKQSSKAAEKQPELHEVQDDDIGDIFKSLRVQDQDECIQRAVCEYEAIKRTKKLSVIEESFVDLFGTAVPEPNENDRHKDSYPFHRAAFIGDHFEDVALCTHTYRSCLKSPASLLSIISHNEQQSNNGIIDPVELNKMIDTTANGRQPNSRLANVKHVTFSDKNNHPLPIVPQSFEGAVAARIPPNINVRPGSKATQFPDGTLLIVEPPVNDIPNIPIFSYPRLPPPPLPGRIPALDPVARQIPIEQVVLPPHPDKPAIFETEVIFSTGSKGLNEVLPKIPKVLDDGMKLAPQMVDLVSHLIKNDIRKPINKHGDFIRDIVKEVVIGHIHKQFNKPSTMVNHSDGKHRPVSSPPAPTSPPRSSTKPPTFPVAPPAIPRTTAAPATTASTLATPASLPRQCPYNCCNCQPQIVKHIHKHFDKKTTTTKKPKKKNTQKKEPFLVIEKEPFRLEIGR